MSGDAERTVAVDWRGGAEIGNEFASVRLRIVDTPTGVRLEVYSLKLGERILLDPVVLESLTWQSPDLFSTFLEQPLGPEAH